MKDPMVEQVREALRREISIIEKRQRHKSLLEDDAIREEQEARDAHCKKGYRFSRPKSGCHLTNSPWPGII